MSTEDSIYFFCGIAPEYCFLTTAAGLGLCFMAVGWIVGRRWDRAAKKRERAR